MKAEAESVDQVQYNQAWEVREWGQWLNRNVLGIALATGLIGGLALCCFFVVPGAVLAISCSILIAGRTIAQAVREGRS